ncbi:MAG: prepilin-type N-terminal cleavage/methylation domain-containing protein [Sedimentisphaerales bacterium]|nr:prepilin-type N-terminal cleavage/methylation domain-containing protein [Sedimentisphaerales bacterium]
MRHAPDNRGFTLAEVLVASTLSAFIALAAVGALKAVTDSSQVVDRATETMGQVRFAARMIADDLHNLYRDPDPRSMKLVATSAESSAGSPTMLTFYAVGSARARVGQPEGDIYEISYFLSKDEGAEPTAEETPDKFILFRRLWPNPDKDRNPGGMLSPIAENIDAFEMRFFDGKQWATQWPEELQSIPELVEITLVTLPRGRGSPVIERFTVNFPRLAAREAAASGGEPPGGQGGGQPQQGAPQMQGNQGIQGPPVSR